MKVLIIHPYPIVGEMIAGLVRKSFSDTEFVFAKDVNQAAGLCDDKAQLDAIIIEPTVGDKPWINLLPELAGVKAFEKIKPITISTPEVRRFLEKTSGAELHIDNRALCSTMIRLLEQRLETTTHQRARPRLSGVSRREREILSMLNVGLTNREVAEKLEISEHTVKVHNWRMFKKLGVCSRTQALKTAKENGWI